MSKKINKRISHKRLRAAEKQVLSGGHTRVAEGSEWGDPVYLVANDEETRYPKKSQKKRRVFRGCPSHPAGKRCEFIEDTRPGYDFEWNDEDKAFDLVPIMEKYKLCVWCDRDVTILESRYNKVAYRIKRAKERSKRKKGL